MTSINRLIRVSYRRLSVNVIVLFVIIILLLIFTTILIYTSSYEKSKDVLVNNAKLKKYLNELENLQKEIDALRQTIEILRSPEPSLEYEQIRRRISSNTKELWYYISSEINEIQKSNPELSDVVKKVLGFAVELKRFVQTDIDSLPTIDGYDDWRQKKINFLSDLVVRRLNHLQNPENCSSAKKLVCDVGINCGFGCQVNYLSQCLMIASATKRTLILTSKNWQYHEGGWTAVYKPISNTCVETNEAITDSWNNTEAQVVTFVHTTASQFLPLHIPEDLAPLLKILHGNPAAWFVGQMMKYLLKPQPTLEQLINKTIEEMGFAHPIVGVQIRRTDKLIAGEASFHDVREYMVAVEEYYAQYDLTQNESNFKRRVFVASDDPNAILEIKSKYPHYEVLGDTEIAKVAAVRTRFSSASLEGLIKEIHILAECDFLVCTLSSSVCKTSYELMQTKFVDASSYFRSLDDMFYCHGQQIHKMLVLLAHEPSNPKEIELKPGDFIEIAGNHWNGYSKGRNLRTNKVGLFPSYKIEDIVETVKYSNIVY